MAAGHALAHLHTKIHVQAQHLSALFALLSAGGSAPKSPIGDLKKFNSRCILASKSPIGDLGAGPIKQGLQVSIYFKMIGSPIAKLMNDSFYRTVKSLKIYPLLIFLNRHLALSLSTNIVDF